MIISWSLCSGLGLLALERALQGRFEVVHRCIVITKALCTHSRALYAATPKEIRISYNFYSFMRGLVDSGCWCTSSQHLYDTWSELGVELTQSTVGAVRHSYYSICYAFCVLELLKDSTTQCNTCVMTGPGSLWALESERATLSLFVHVLERMQTLNASGISFVQLSSKSWQQATRFFESATRSERCWKYFQDSKTWF